MITLSENETNNDSDKENYNYGFHSNTQKCSHCSENFSMMSLATYLLIGLGLGLVLISV